MAQCSIVSHTHLLDKSQCWTYFYQLSLLDGLLHGCKWLCFVPGRAGTLGLLLPLICDAPICYHTVDENASLSILPLPEAFGFQ